MEAQERRYINLVFFRHKKFHYKTIKGHKKFGKLPTPTTFIDIPILQNIYLNCLTAMAEGLQQVNDIQIEFELMEKFIDLAKKIAKRNLNAKLAWEMFRSGQRRRQNMDYILNAVEEKVNKIYQK
jgi:hypothetical protein